MKVGIVGCGLIGKRRASVIHQSASDEPIIVADIDESRAENLAAEMDCMATTNWREVVTRDDLNVVIVSTTNKFLMPVTVAALEHGKHVLCEKPLGRNYNEAQQMVESAWRAGVLLKTGFNHRHHPAILKAHELCSQGAIGPIIFIRAIYGHGGRPGYDKEWRADPDLAGGGELLDQGVHIVDLCRWFMGDFTEAFGHISTYYWNLGYFPSSHNYQPSIPSYEPSAISHLPPTTHHQLEDNAFVILRASDDRVAQFHTSWTQWKNRFSFEVFGKDGYIRVEGLGGSYGIEKLEVGKKHPDEGPPIEEVWNFPGPDLSWQAEWKEFSSAIKEKRQPMANGEDGLEAMRLIDAIYESARENRPIKIRQDEG
jgi:predicted dehydrogenase